MIDPFTIIHWDSSSIYHIISPIQESIRYLIYDRFHGHMALDRIYARLQEDDVYSAWEREGLDLPADFQNISLVFSLTVSMYLSYLEYADTASIVVTLPVTTLFEGGLGTYYDAATVLLRNVDEHLKAYYNDPIFFNPRYDERVLGLIDILARNTDPNEIEHMLLGRPPAVPDRCYTNFYHATNLLRNGSELRGSSMGIFLDSSGIGDCEPAPVIRISNEAQERALNLLLENLNAEQREEYLEYKLFRVVGNRGGMYTIKRERQVNIINGAGDRLCAVSKESVPLEDMLLAQKLLIETDEDEFLRVAINWGKRNISSYGYANPSPARGGGFDFSFVPSAPEVV